MPSMTLRGKGRARETALVFPRPSFPSPSGRTGFFVGMSSGRARRVARLLACLVLSLLLPSCEAADAGPSRSTLTDDAGTEVALRPEARTVVSLVPSLTELIREMGAGDRLVARTTADAARELRHLPVVGRPATPSLERLLALSPELVVVWADEGDPAALAARLRDAEIRVYTARVMSLGELDRHLGAMGKLLGMEAAADSLALEMARALDAAGREVPEDARPSVAYLVWPMPPSVAGPGTFIDEIITRAGGRNAFRDLPLRWPTVSPETLLERDPDVLVVARGRPPVSSGEGIWAEPPLSLLGAVREGRILRVPSDLFERPGPGTAQAVRILAEHLHGPRIR